MKLQEITTWDELRSWLMDRMESVSTDKSKANKSLTTSQIWSFYIKMCSERVGMIFPVRTGAILLKNIGKDFNDSMGQ